MDSLQSTWCGTAKTAWTLTGQHTGLTDLPLTERGECNARSLGDRLKALSFLRVFTSPLQRASRTCELAGRGGQAEVDRDLVEWNYGDYEGLRTADIHAIRADWDMFRDGCPGGETLEQIGARADRVVSRIRSINGPSSSSPTVWPVWARIFILLWATAMVLGIVGVFRS